MLKSADLLFTDHHIARVDAVPAPPLTPCLRGGRAAKGGGLGVLAGASTQRCQEGELRGFAAAMARAVRRTRKQALSPLRVRAMTLGTVASVAALGPAICSSGSKPIFREDR